MSYCNVPSPPLSSVKLCLYRASFYQIYKPKITSMLPTAPACSSVDVQDSYLFAFWSFHLYHKCTPLDSTPLEPRLSGKGKVLAPANMVKLNQLITEATSIS